MIMFNRAFVHAKMHDAVMKQEQKRGPLSGRQHIAGPESMDPGFILSLFRLENAQINVTGQVVLDCMEYGNHATWANTFL